MKVFDLLKAGLFIMALVLTVLFAGLISERYKVVHIQKELLQYDRALKIEEVKIKKKQLAEEAVQVAAVAEKFMQTIDLKGVED